MSTWDANRDAAIRDIAKKDLFIETLERRMRDALDFHEVSVWGVEAALIAAYEAGRAAERRRRTPTQCECPACGRRIDIKPLT
ncbi:MAG: hypothetical protein U0575_04160 [Phycisphaerales bacterium]